MRLSILAMNIDRKWLATYAVLAFVLGSFLGGAMWNFAGIYVPEVPPVNLLKEGSLLKFESEQQLVTFLQTRPQTYYYEDFNVAVGRGFFSSFKGAIVAESLDAAPGTSPSNPAGNLDYSGTNIQVEGVDEADIVKTDGNYIYLASRDRVFIVKAFPPEEAKISSTIEFDFFVSNLYVNKDKLVVIQSQDLYYSWGPWDIVPPEEYMISTIVHIYDIADRAKPEIERTIRVDGFLTNSRMIGDYVYTITSQPSILNFTEAILPTIKTNNSTCTVEAEDIWYANTTDPYCGFTNILAINVQKPEEVTHETLLLGSSSTLFVSLNSIYLTSPWWVEDETGSWETTRVYKINVDESKIEYVADGSIPGRVLNQFSMDEHDGYFRIATTNGQVSRQGGKTSNNVYVLDGGLETVGSLEGLAPGESIYSARFMGKRCYLVTFKKVDPLFTIDLADPDNPKVLGKLKIPGYSDYLHPYDENTLIGIGKETEEAEEGDFAWYQGVKISLFDVSDVENPRELSKVEIGDRGTDSPALHEHKAFLFSRQRNMLVIPVLVAEINSQQYSEQVPPNAYGDYVYQGAYVYDISREGGIQLRGRISHIDGDEVFMKSGYWFDSELSIERSLYINDVLYTISNGMIKLNHVEDLSEIGSVRLPYP